ncbi:MAG: ABC transporter substrate-binding protein [Clostridia bacterium]|nr:ABC transporter substrate-binding protein [Clostridia bacterium]
MKKSIKLVAVLVALAMLALVAFTGCGNQPSGDNAEEPSTDAPQAAALNIGVIQYISHPSLDNCYAGIKEALETAYGENVNIDFQIGSDSSADADCASYAKAMVAKNYDMIIAIATPAAISAYAATEGTDIPVIFCSVSDPVAAKLVNTLDAPGGNCTGTSDVLDLEDQLELILTLQPEAKTVGILYTTSEVNSISNLEVFREVCAAKGVTVEASGVQSASDIPAAANALAAKVDCINNFTDNNVVNNLSVVLDAAANAGIPVYGSEIEQVKNGCLGSVSIDYVAVGRMTGEMAAEVLNGADITAMAVKTVSDSTPVINTEVLAALGIELPAALADAETVVTNK